MVQEGVSDGTGRSIRCYKEYQMEWQVSDGTIEVSHSMCQGLSKRRVFPTLNSKAAGRL